MCHSMYAEQFSSGKYLHLGPSARMEANAILAVSQTYIFNNSSAADQITLLLYVVSLHHDKSGWTVFHPSATHHLWSDVSISRLTVVFHGATLQFRGMNILRSHFLLLLWPINIPGSHIALHLYPTFVAEPELVQVQCLSWDWFLSLIDRLRF